MADVEVGERKGRRPEPDGMGGGQCPYRAKGQCHPGHQAGLGAAKIDLQMAAFNAIALMVTKPWSTRPSIFVI
jgi:hypothetical protein